MFENHEQINGSRSSLDVTAAEEVAKESRGVSSRRKERTIGLLSKRQQMPISEEVPEESTLLQSAESEQDSNNLPFTLTQEQKVLVQQADGVQDLLALCDASRPTQSLDILWVASQRISNTQAIILLQYSSLYDNGDTLYLKRNWLELASLLRQNGRSEEAAKYEQLASSLP